MTAEIELFGVDGVKLTTDHFLTLDYNHDKEMWQAQAHSRLGHVLYAYGMGETPKDALLDLHVTEAWKMTERRRIIKEQEHG